MTADIEKMPIVKLQDKIIFQMKICKDIQRYIDGLNKLNKSFAKNEQSYDLFYTKSSSSSAEYSKRLNEAYKNINTIQIEHYTSQLKEEDDELGLLIAELDKRMRAKLNKT